MIRKNKGFTLIELLVVIAIIGILSSVVLASLNTARRKARDARRLSDVKQIQLALEMYFDSNPTTGYPASLSLLATDGYLPVVPTPPAGAGQTVYSYAALGSGTSCTSYHLGTTLEETGNTALLNDADAAAGTVCTDGGTDFAGTDPLYDVKP